jgi:membrane protease YdiL (CAAX protease family)
LIVYKTKSLTIPTIMHIFGNFLSTIIFAIYDKLL